MTVRPGNLLDPAATEFTDYEQGAVFRTGKSKKGRYVSSAGLNGGARVVRYYAQQQLADFNAAILAELGEPPTTRIVDVLDRYTITEGGWRKNGAAAGNGRRSAKRKACLDGARQLPEAACKRIDALRQRLLRTGDAEGAEECRLALVELGFCSAGSASVGRAGGRLKAL